MKLITKLPYYLLLIIWTIIVLADLITHFTIAEKLVYWRAWEKVANYDGTDGSTVPFKPLLTYDGPLSGDLLNAAYLLPRNTEKDHQIFTVDEYGFRNKRGLLKQPVEAVVEGSSFVAGAREREENLATTLLTEKYSIPTYNYATIPLKHFWEDARFKKNKPQYLILLGSEGEMITGLWRYEIPDSAATVTVPAWGSHEEWKKQKERPERTFVKFEQNLKNFSLVRVVSNKVYTHYLNILYTRKQLTEMFPQGNVSYDADSDMLFYGLQYDNPILNESDKTTKAIQDAVTALQKTRDKLAERDITLIVAAMPSKAHIEHPKYKYLSRDRRALVIFEKVMEEANIEHVKLFDAMYRTRWQTNKPLYYTDDSHWNAEANKIIVDELAKKIASLKEAAGR